MLLRVRLDEKLGRFPAELPRRHRRYGAVVNGIEIPPRRQHFRASAARRARGSRRDEASGETGEQADDLGAAA